MRGDLRRRAAVALVPRLAFGLDRLQPVIGQFDFARGRLRFDPQFGAGAALASDHFVDRRELGFDLGGGRQCGERLFRFAARGLSLVAAGAGALPALP